MEGKTKMKKKKKERTSVVVFYSYYQRGDFKKKAFVLWRPPNNIYRVQAHKLQ